ncbi:hypothetical protein HGRIS_000592 [Hohenbuehelia grisea]
MNDGTEVVARVAFNYVDYPETASRQMESEVATMQWVRAHTDIPIPAILFTCTDPTNPVGAAYMLMEKSVGHSLSKVWDTISQTQKDKLIAQLAQINVTLMKACSFKQIGSIFSVDGAFSIEPIVPSCFPWVFRRDLGLDRGPWASEREYLGACATRELDWINRHQGELAAAWTKEDMGPGEIVAGYTELLHRLQVEISRLEWLDRPYGGLGPFILYHPDLGLGNIIVQEDDPIMITGIIDWECSYAAPLCTVTAVPEFIQECSDDWIGDPATPASNREIYVKACSNALPGVFEPAHKAGRKLRKLERVTQLITTRVPLETIQKEVALIFDDV